MDGLNQMKIVRTVLAGVLVAVGAGAGSAAAGAAHAARAAKAAPHGTLTIDWTADFPTLDPGPWQDLQSQIPMLAIYDQLVGYSVKASDPTRIVGDLASSWTVSKNGLVYTFHLRHGVRFSTGDPCTAADVVYSLNRETSYDAAGPSGAAPYGSSYSDIVGYNQWFNGGKKPPKNVKGLSGLSAPNPYTVVIHLQKPQAFFLNELALPAASILDPKVVEKWGNNYETHATGTGPYMLKYWHQNVQMVLVPNPYYSGPTPAKLAQIVMNVNINPTTQLLDFKQGKNDIIFQPNSETYLDIYESPSLRGDYIKDATNAIWYLSFNETKPPFNNQLAREAVNLAINRQAILRLINGRGTIMTQPLPPKMPGYQKSLKPYPYNPTEAKKLLRQAGVKPGTQITLVYTTARPFVQQVMQNIQEQLAKVGLTVNLHNISASGPFFAYQEQPSNPFNISWSDWWQDYPDPEDFLYNLLDSQNAPGLDVGSYTNKTFNQLVQEADVLPASQQAERLRLYDRAQDIALSQYAWVPLFYPVLDAVVSPNVQPHNVDVLVHPVDALMLRYLSVK
jgi:ABC-type transport system substrate-binding protein